VKIPSREGVVALVDAAIACGRVCGIGIGTNQNDPDDEQKQVEVRAALITAFDTLQAEIDWREHGSRDSYPEMVPGHWKRRAEDLQSRLESLDVALNRMRWLTNAEVVDVKEMLKEREGKNAAYHERDQVVALVARMALALGWRAGLRRHEPDPDPAWEEGWENVVAIDLPTGMVTWHYHDSERSLFASLPPYPDHWDGHDTREKYRRVNAALAPKEPTP
jgi:hypothetical protein